MTARTMNDDRIKAAISVSRMCSLLMMSRSQFYAHVRKGTFHAPLKLPNGRPYYNASMVEDNLKAREMGIGVGGEFVIFYERAEPVLSGPTKPTAKPKTDFTDLMENLQSLGLSTLTTAIVEKAVAESFPKGTAGQDEQHILRTVFRHLKRAGIG
jgi:predicted DNA-binding transcriptional regulator AlpA